MVHQEEVLRNPSLSVKDLCAIGMFVTIIAICAQISIPMPIGVPMTLQTFAIPLAGAVLGVKNGLIATLVYIALGAIGAPVFTGFAGGAGVLFGRTGGFIFGFPFMAIAAGIGSRSLQATGTGSRTDKVPGLISRKAARSDKAAEIGSESRQAHGTGSSGFAHRSKIVSTLIFSLWLVVGAGFVYTFGMIMFAFVTNSNIPAAFTIVVLPFMPTEIIKIVMVIMFSRVLRKALSKSGLLTA